LLERGIPVFKRELEYQDRERGMLGEKERETSHNWVQHMVKVKLHLVLVPLQLESFSPYNLNTFSRGDRSRVLRQQRGDIEREHKLISLPAPLASCAAIRLDLSTCRKEEWRPAKALRARSRKSKQL
jgi:hypothetical protein